MRKSALPKLLNKEEHHEKHTKKNLTSLDLRANRFISLPQSIGELTKLEKLDVRWNNISSSPGVLQSLEQRGCVVYR